jgi:predicted restriction endonuclease
MHVLFDKGAIAIKDDLTLIGIEGYLDVNQDHPVSLEYLRYHREHIYKLG